MFTTMYHFSGNHLIRVADETGESAFKERRKTSLEIIALACFWTIGTQSALEVVTVYASPISATYNHRIYTTKLTTNIVLTI